MIARYGYIEHRPLIFQLKKHIVSKPIKISKVRHVSYSHQMSGSHHSLISLGSSNLSTHYTLVCLCPSSTFSTQPHILTEVNRTIGSFTLYPVLLNLVTTYVQSSYHIHQRTHINKQTRKKDETQAYVLLSGNHSWPLKQ